MRLILIAIVTAISINTNAQIFEVGSGAVHFHSDAPQELIKAQSAQLRGAIDVKKKTFAFRIIISSFQGFNSPLQREHFNENYMETNKYPEGTFVGKIIEDVDASKDGEYDVRAKGKLTIHGLEQERIIKAHISTKKGKMLVTSDFTVTLADYNIKIPRVVYDKLAPDISVSVNATLHPR